MTQNTHQNSDFGISSLQEILRGQKKINAPDTGLSEISEFISKSQFWPEEKVNKIEHIATTKALPLTFVEYNFTSILSDGSALPVLFVIDEEANETRIYSDVSINLERKSTLSSSNKIAGKDTSSMSELLNAMAKNDLDKAMSTFAEDASFAHSDGKTVSGKAALRDEFSGMMGASGFTMTPMTIASNGVYIASECSMPGGRINAGVYELDANNSDLIQTVRTYM